MLLPLSALIPGFFLLAFSADLFVNNAIGLARRLNISPRLVALLVMSLGTSAPEIFVSVSAAFTHRDSLAIGNALGSNIANIGLVMGVTLAVCPLLPGYINAGRELGLMVLVTLGAALVLYDYHMGWMESVLMLGASLACTGLLYRWQQRPGTDDADSPASGEPAENDDSVESSLGKTLVLLTGGLVLLLASSRVLVWVAAVVARELGVSELTIGLTVVALGTSLPELAACMASALKGRQDMAIATVTGSNIFNLLIVMAIPGLVAPVTVESFAFLRDYTAMLLMTLLVIVLLRPVRRGGKFFKRLPGLVLLAAYLVYVGCLAI
ncbi:MAG: calcium/sodium antiporter [Kistimonas sp.]|nr:calcium/sodium antiporter [Kistimonas sp.]